MIITQPKYTQTDLVEKFKTPWICSEFVIRPKRKEEKNHHALGKTIHLNKLGKKMQSWKLTSVVVSVPCSTINSSDTPQNKTTTTTTTKYSILRFIDVKPSTAHKDEKEGGHLSWQYNYHKLGYNLLTHLYLQSSCPSNSCQSVHQISQSYYVYTEIGIYRLLVSRSVVWDL